MTQKARLVGTICAIATIVVVNSTAHSLAQETSQFNVASNKVLTLEFSATTNQHTIHRRANSSKSHTAMWSRIRSHRAAKTGLSNSKVGMPGHASTGEGKMGVGPGKMSDGPGKLGDDPSKMNNGPGKLGAGPAGTGTKVFMETNMEPSNTTTPTKNAKDPQESADTPKNPAAASGKNKKNITEIEWFEKHAALMKRNLAKNPEQDPSVLSDRLTNELNKIYIRVDEPKDQSGMATPEKALTDEQRRAYWEATRKDHEETERLKAEQKARENFNPNAEKYRESGITEKEHDDLNKKTLPGKPNGTE